MHGRRNGFLMPDFLMTMLITVIMAQIVVSSLVLLLHSVSFDQEVQDEIAIAQLRRILIISTDFKTTADTLYFTNQGREMKLRVVNDNLIIQPGTQIMLVDVDGVTFMEQGHTIVCHYERNGAQHERIIALQ